MAEKRIVRQLKQTLGELSAEQASALVDAVERDRMASGTMPHGLILDALRPKLQGPGGASSRRGGAPTPVRHFCWPFEELLVNGTPERKYRGRIARTSIMPVWSWLAEDLLRDALADISLRIVEHTLAKNQEQLADAVADLYAMCATGIRDALEAVKSASKARRALTARLGGEHVLEDAQEMGLMLQAAPLLETFKRNMPRTVPDLTPALARQVRDLFDDLAAIDPDAPPYAAVIAMRHIEKPWQMFRIVKGVAHTETDVLISRTDIAIVGELLLLEMEEAVDCLEDVDPGHDPGQLASQLERFTQISRGITEEIGIRRDGMWAMRLMSARGAVSEIIRERMDRAPATIVKALPMKSLGRPGRGGLRRPDLSREIEHRAVEDATNTLRFLGRARRYAHPGSFVGPLNAAVAEIDQYLDEYERAIVEELRSEDPAARERGEVYLDVIAGFIEIFRSSDEAALLRKRGILARDAAVA